MEPTQPGQFGDLAELESALGYAFGRRELLLQALAHRSRTHALALDATGEPDHRRRNDNERLEFLGDAVIGLLVTEALFEAYPDWQEGELTRLRAQLVNRQHLAAVAESIDLGRHLRLSKDIERSGGRGNAYILANAMEAVVAAMFLDAGAGTSNGSVPGGALEPVRRFAQTHILGTRASELAHELRSGGALGDFKSKLQAHLQATRAGIPVYRVRSESGPDHRKRFEIEVLARTSDGRTGEALAAGEGVSRKRAEQEAARRALARLEREPAVQEPAEV